MKIALASMAVKTKDIIGNLNTMLEAIDACRKKADLIVFGEAFLQGFDCLCWDYELDKKVAISLHDEPIKRIQESAKKNSIAVSFGFIERKDDCLYSSQIFIDNKGEVINLFHRVSIGWKEYDKTDDHYLEGKSFSKFTYKEKSFSIGLCGDLWDEKRVSEMAFINADIVLWPVWCDYNANDWNKTIKY